MAGSGAAFCTKGGYSLSPIPLSILKRRQAHAMLCYGLHIAQGKWMFKLVIRQLLVVSLWLLFARLDTYSTNCHRQALRRVTMPSQPQIGSHLNRARSSQVS